jgi:hypothetical protein
VQGEKKDREGIEREREKERERERETERVKALVTASSDSWWSVIQRCPVCRAYFIFVPRTVDILEAWIKAKLSGKYALH